MQSEGNLRAVAGKLGFDPDYLDAFERKLFISGQEAPRRLTNFFVLLLLATVIATFGVISDSTATVIGAMIVAPLMGPIMATAAAVVMGSAPRALRSLALVLVGAVCVILLSMVLAWITPDVSIAFAENAEIGSRIAPGLTALLTALASGAAGAFITSREEIADSIGGVAIAISLVPPLCVVGIALTLGEWSAGIGALTLFLTNFLAILLAGGITFIFGGLGRLALTDTHQRMRRNAFALIVAATVLVAIPLSITTWQAIDGALERRAAAAEVETWLAGSTYEPLEVAVYEQRVNVTVEGSGELPALRTLANALAKTLERPIVVNLRALPTQMESSGPG